MTSVSRIPARVLRRLSTVLIALVEMRLVSGLKWKTLLSENSLSLVRMNSILSSVMIV